MKIAQALFIVIFAILGALIVGWWVNRSHIEQMYAEKVVAFIAAGPRFTAFDGQKLCDQLRHLAEHSFGWKKSGHPLPDCDFLKEPKKETPKASPSTTQG